jgi:hypothetical protein
MISEYTNLNLNLFNKVILTSSVRYEDLTWVKIQVDIFWFVTPCSVVVTYHGTTRRHNPQHNDLDLNLVPCLAGRTQIDVV